ncbi:MAG: DNA repair protein RecO [bacterium]|nr:DNA repair protein RecO [bacterium]
MRNFNVKAILLKKYKVSDSDLSCRILTKEFGKISVWVRNARTHSKKSSINDKLDFFAIYEVGLYRNNYNRKNKVTNIKLESPNLKIRASIDKFEDASFLISFVDRITSDETGSDYFAQVIKILELLNEGKYGLAVEIICFTFFKLAGYDFIFDECVSCRLKLDRKISKVKFSASCGGIICNNCVENTFSIDGEVLEFFKLLKILEISQLLCMADSDLERKLCIQSMKIFKGKLRVMIEKILLALDMT